MLHDLSDLRFNKITVFGKNNCKWCHHVKDWLDILQYSYDYLDITKDVEALRTWRAILANKVVVPIIAYRDHYVIGFEESSLYELLK